MTSAEKRGDCLFGVDTGIALVRAGESRRVDVKITHGMILDRLVMSSRVAHCIDGITIETEHACIRLSHPAMRYPASVLETSTMRLEPRLRFRPGELVTFTIAAGVKCRAVMTCIGAAL